MIQHKRIRRICLISGGGLGDLVALLPALHVLRQTYGDAHIEMIGISSWLPLLEERGYIDRGLSIDDVPLYLLFRSTGIGADEPFARFLKGFDLIVSWLGDEEGLLDRNLKALPGPLAFVFPFRDHARFPGHISDYYLSTVKSMGMNVERACYRILPSRRPTTLHTIVPSVAATHPKGIICIHPGSGLQAKNWPLENFITAARTLTQQSGSEVVFVVGPAENNQITTATITDAMPSAFVVQEPPITTLASLLEASSLYLGNDSGPTHLAASTGTPTLAIFGPTSTIRWAPRGQRVHIMALDVPCRPCSTTASKTCFQRVCLTGITPTAVVEAALSLMDHARYQPVASGHEGWFLKR